VRQGHRVFGLSSGKKKKQTKRKEKQKMSKQGSAAEMVEAIVRKIVDKPDEVKVSEVSGDYTQVIEVRVAKGEMGKVVGKQGAHAQAIRTLLMAATGKDGIRYILELVDD
jgi:predicted RNA-binding protein YlqC (UPF0109 family)